MAWFEKNGSEPDGPSIWIEGFRAIAETRAGFVADCANRLFEAQVAQQAFDLVGAKLGSQTHPPAPLGPALEIAIAGVIDQAQRSAEDPVVIQRQVADALARRMRGQRDDESDASWTALGDLARAIKQALEKSEASSGVSCTSTVNEWLSRQWPSEAVRPNGDVRRIVDSYPGQPSGEGFKKYFVFHATTQALFHLVPPGRRRDHVTEWLCNSEEAQKRARTKMGPELAAAVRAKLYECCLERMEHVVRRYDPEKGLLWAYFSRAFGRWLRRFQALPPQLHLLTEASLESAADFPDDDFRAKRADEVKHRLTPRRGVDPDQRLWRDAVRLFHGIEPVIPEKLPAGLPDIKLVLTDRDDVPWPPRDTDWLDAAQTDGVRWSCADPRVVSVDDGGRVTAVAPGITTITESVPNGAPKTLFVQVFKNRYAWLVWELNIRHRHPNKRMTPDNARAHTSRGRRKLLTLLARHPIQITWQRGSSLPNGDRRLTVRVNVGSVKDECGVPPPAGWPVFVVWDTELWLSCSPDDLASPLTEPARIPQGWHFGEVDVAVKPWGNRFAVTASCGGPAKTEWVTFD